MAGPGQQEEGGGWHSGQRSGSSGHHIAGQYHSNFPLTHGVFGCLGGSDKIQDSQHGTEAKLLGWCASHLSVCNPWQTFVATGTSMHEKHIYFSWGGHSKCHREVLRSGSGGYLQRVWRLLERGKAITYIATPRNLECLRFR